MGIDGIKSATPEGAMRIVVIGAGNIGRTLGAKWVTAGHEVVYGVRSPGAPETADSQTQAQWRVQDIKRRPWVAA
jgi:predicted dinucleotide-binding enzyme